MSIPMQRYRPAFHQQLHAEGLLVGAHMAEDALGEYYSREEVDDLIAKLKRSHRRYEFLRTLNVPQFQALYRDNIEKGIPFDELVDTAIAMHRFHATRSL